MAAGLDEDLYWSLTPRQVIRHLDAVHKRQRREHNARMEQAFITAAFMSSKPPKLRDLLVSDDPKPKAPQDWRVMKATLMVALSTGGTDGRK